QCKTKAHLKASGAQGPASEYESLLAALKSTTGKMVAEWVSARHPRDAVLHDVAVTAAVLRTGSPFVLGATVENDAICLAYDGLTKVPGASALGEFHYAPVLFCPGETVRLDDKILLALLGGVLGELQGRQPQAGVVFCGRRCRAAKVWLND